MPDSVADICPTCMLLKGALQSLGVSPPVAETIAYAPPVQQAEDRVVRKVKRKASSYQKKLGKAIKALKKKHPKTKMSTLMKRAHKQVKRSLK